MYFSFQYSDTILELQDNTSVPGMPLAAGLTIESLSSHTVDEKGNKAFVTHNPLELLRKVRHLTEWLLWLYGNECVISKATKVMIRKGRMVLDEKVPCWAVLEHAWNCLPGHHVSRALAYRLTHVMPCHTSVPAAKYYWMAAGFSLTGSLAMLNDKPADGTVPHASAMIARLLHL